MRLTFKIIIIFKLILIISSFNNKNSSYLKYEFTKCSDDFTQDIIINNPNQLPINDIYEELVSKNNIKCLSCDEGFYIGYDFEKNISKCIECPSGYYSKGGNFIIDGNYNEWTDDILTKFQSNSCFLDIKERNILNETYCNSFRILDNKMMISGGTLNVEDSIDSAYVAQISFNFNLIKDGHITFIYQKDTIFENNKYTGEFRFFINYMDEYVDDEISNNINEINKKEYESENIKWKKFTKNLKPGNYSILFQYRKNILSKLSNDLSLKIKYLEINGIEYASHDCFPCINGYSKIGSSHCTLCEENYIFNNTLKQCQKCMDGKITKDGFTCEFLEKCESKDYYFKVDELCNIETNKQKLKYNLFSSSKCKNYNDEFKEKEIDCLECPIGKYFRYLENGINKKCEYCPDGTYSNNKNSVECKICEGSIKKVSYYYDIENEKFKSEIIIIKQKGFLSIDYDIINTNEKYSLYLYIDNKLYFSDIKSKTTEIELNLGKHLIEIDSKNININYIKIKNTQEGGGYSCEKCSEEYLFVDENNTKSCVLCEPGYELNEIAKKCIKCNNDKIKEGFGNKNKCRKCPKYTKPDKSNKFCQVSNFVHYKEDKRLFYFQKFSFELSNLCKINKILCNNNLYGPIHDEERNFYYISYNSPTLFQNQDFFFKENKETDLFSPGFIYKLENVNNSKNQKILKQLANKINEVLIVNEIKDRGIIVHYIGNEICEKNINNNINSYFYFKCSKNQYIKDGIIIFNSPKLIHKDECNYYFEWESSSGCPICLTNEAQKMDSSCVNGIKFNYYTETSTCIIYDKIKIPNKIIESDESNDIEDISNEEPDILLTKEYQILGKIYNISFSEKNFEDNIIENDKNLKVAYITNRREQIKCIEEYENIKENFNIFVIFLPILFVIIIIFCIFFILKYRKIKNNYMRLEEEE